MYVSLYTYDVKVPIFSQHIFPYGLCHTGLTCLLASICESTVWQCTEDFNFEVLSNYSQLNGKDGFLSCPSSYIYFSSTYFGFKSKGQFLLWLSYTSYQSLISDFRIYITTVLIHVHTHRSSFRCVLCNGL